MLKIKNMSFMLTTKQFVDGDKDVTRRLGWTTLQPGEHFSAVEKSQGLRKGEKVKYLGQCVCVSNTPEPLTEIIKRPVRPDQVFVGGYGETEMSREGFPNLTAHGFVEMFCLHMKCTPKDTVNRIVFRRWNGNGTA